MYVDILVVRRVWFGRMQLLRGITQPAWNVDGDADADGEVVKSTTSTCCVHQKSLPKPLLLMQPAIAWHHSGDPKHKRLSLSLSDSRTRKQQVLLFPAERLRKCWAPNIFNDTKGFFCDCTFCLNFVIAKTYYRRRQSKRRRKKNIFTFPRNLPRK